jgi:hypothetical protein
MPNDHTVNEQEMNDGVEAVDHPEDDDAIVLNEFATPENERRDATRAGVLQSDETGDKWAVDVGVDVVGSCGHKIGEVVDVRDDYVVVEKGFFIPEDVFVPKSAISGADDHHLTLNVTKDYATHSDWDEDPDDRPVGRNRRAS